MNGAWPFTAQEHLQWAQTSFMCMNAYPKYRKHFEHDLWLDLLHWAWLGGAA